MATVIRRRVGANKSMPTALHTGLFFKPTRGVLHKKGRVIKGASFNFLQQFEEIESTGVSRVRFCDGGSHRVAVVRTACTIIQSVINVKRRKFWDVSFTYSGRQLRLLCHMYIHTHILKQTTCKQQLVYSIA